MADHGEEPVMARIKAPVAAFFGENDLGLAPRVAPATADMKRLGKSFEVHVYPETRRTCSLSSGSGSQRRGHGRCVAEGDGIFQDPPVERGATASR